MHIYLVQSVIWLSSYYILNLHNVCTIMHEQIAMPCKGRKMTPKSS